MAKYNIMAIPGGGGGIRARITGGISGKSASKINPVYKETGIEKRALKAANSPVSPGNKGIGGPNVRNAIISGKPANPNVTRGGSMRSKLGWDWNK